MATKAKVVVAWVSQQELDAFMEAWSLNTVPEFLHLQRDVDREGCGATKNRGVQAAAASGAEIVVVLDGDCYPAEDAPTLEELVEDHVLALEPQDVQIYAAVTYPHSRGVPYHDASMCIRVPVACSMGFWLNVPDYCAPRQLSFAAEGSDMVFHRETVYERYFPLCGMNIAFKPADWWPLITHSRQSNVWKNLIDEARYLEQTETLWREIATHHYGDYASLLSLLPADAIGGPVGARMLAERSLIDGAEIKRNSSLVDRHMTP
jgi:hypothetical protein